MVIYIKEKKSYLFKNILLFSLNGFLPKILTFFLIPIYTSYLSTYDYGISDLINTSASLLLPIFTLQIQDAVLRYTIDSKYNKDEVFSIALKTNFWGFIFVLIFSSLFYSLNLLNGSSVTTQSPPNPTFSHTNVTGSDT